MRNVILLLLASVCCWTVESAPTPTYDEVTIENGVVRVAVSTLRASLRRVELLDTQPILLPRHARNGPNVLPAGPLPVLRAFMTSGNHNWIYSDNGGLTSAAWTVRIKEKDRVTLGFTTANGLDWAMTYALAPQSLEVGVQLVVRNQGAAVAPLEVRVFPVVGVHADYAQSEVGYQSVFSHAGGVAGSITNHGMPEIQARTDINSHDVPLGAGGTTDYVGMKSRFFAAWCKPGARLESSLARPAGDQPQGLDGMMQGSPTAVAPATDWQAVARGFQGSDGVAQALLLISYAKADLEPGKTWQRSWSITSAGMTKKHIAMLPEAEQVVKYTDGFYRFFKLLANAMTWILDLLAKAMPYGVAVIALTFLIKAALYRTTFKQQESMLKMQKVAPELKYIQQQYANNKQLLAQKQMELFKKHGVNPLGGCLPMLIQLPIFIALFQAFSHCADLRGSHFLWISDLTLPDQLIGMPISYLGGWVLSLNPLPIIYIGVSAWMSFNQTMPTNSDPQQEMMFKMMRWMPVIFGVIFYNMPSGLVLYFTVQAVISTLEMKYIRRKLGLG